jgi:hypothetical protein
LFLEDWHAQLICTLDSPSENVQSQAVEHARIEEIPETSTSEAIGAQQRILEHWGTQRRHQET